MNLLLAGAGTWGQKYITTISKLGLNLEVANRNNWRSLIDESPDGVIIATPPSSHIEIAEYALDRNIPVMIEKPLALTLSDAKQLKKYDSKKILVNNIHLFSSAYQELVRIVSKEGVKSIYSSGMNAGPYRDYSALLDYGSHDLSMGMFLCDPGSVELQYCSETIIGRGKNWDLLFMYDDSIQHRCVVGNGGLLKRRLFEVTTLRGNIIKYNDLAEDKLTFNDKVLDISSALPLENACFRFLSTILGETDDRNGIQLSLKYLQVLGPLV